MRQLLQKRKNTGPAAVLALVFFLCPVALPAQEAPVFESSGPTREVPEGSRFEVAFTLKNTVAKRFIPPDFKGLRVLTGPSELRSAGFVNGKSYNHQTWTYELEAGAPGSYTIGSAAVQTGAQTLRAQPLVVRVGKARPGRMPSPPSGPADQLFISGELDRATAWQGQQLRFQIKLYTQASVSDYDILDLPAFEGFFSQERRRFDTRTQYQTIRGKRYAVRILYELSLYPQQAGDLRIGAARVRVGVEQPGSLSALLGSIPVVLQTQPVQLKVKPLPEPVPKAFTGGVGVYKWRVTADKDTLSTDDALALTVALEGNGDARSFAHPRFDLPGGLEGFEPRTVEQEEYETGESFVHTRTLEYVILPRRPGVYTFTPELVYFDPDSNKYRSLQTEQPVRLRVAPGPTYGQQTAPLDTIAAPPPAPSAISLVWNKVPGWLGAPWFWGTLAGVALIWAAAFLYRLRPAASGAPAAAIDDRRVKLSLKSMRTRFLGVQKLIQQGDARVFYHELLKALQGYVAVRLGAEPFILTKEYMEEQLTERRVPAATTGKITRVWQKCEQAVFAGQAAVAGMHATWEEAETALQELDAALK
ncbi:MAG: protein BatD [Saprospirales bacterium]|nr:protein BatD [Saprospirales bacterium]